MVGDCITTRQLNNAVTHATREQILLEILATFRFLMEEKHKKAQVCHACWLPKSNPSYL